MALMDDIRARLEGLALRSRKRELRRETGISFSHNDYLGLAGHPRLVEAGRRALDVFGTGSRGSRLLGGNSSVFEGVERKIADFFGAPSALFFSTGYLANLAACQALGSVADTVFSEKRNHASLIDGIRLCGAPKRLVEPDGWRAAVDGAATDRSLLVAESLYSMDGDFVDIEALGEAWRRSGAFLLLDEAHAAGAFLEEGRGWQVRLGGPERWERLAVTVTFGKSFGVAGAAVLCSVAVRDWLINQARAFIFTTAPSPVVAAMVAEALDVVRDESWRREELWSRARLVRSFLREANALGRGTPAPASRGPWDEASPIIPFLVPGDDNALRFAESMRNFGIDLRAIRYPTVPEGGERIRLSLSLAVSRENTEAMAREVVRRWTEFSSQGSIRA